MTTGPAEAGHYDRPVRSVRLQADLARSSCGSRTRRKCDFFTGSEAGHYDCPVRSVRLQADLARSGLRVGESTEVGPCHAGVLRIQSKGGDHGHGREMAVHGVSDAASTLAVNHLNAIGASKQ